MALAIGALLFAAPPPSHADPITISAVQVTVGAQTWCNTGNGACDAAHQIWNLGGGVTLNAGQTLVLSQTTPAAGQPNFDFDTTEGNAAGCLASAGRPCATSIKFNGGANTTLINGQDTASVLANGNLDTGGNAHNEAANWVMASASKAILGQGTLFFGYADNLHTNACADGSAAPGQCFPNSSALDVFFNATRFIGNGVSGAGFPQGGDFHCNTTNGSNTCWDAGAILVRNDQTPVPEPVTMFLGGTGLILLAFAARRRLFSSLSLVQ